MGNINKGLLGSAVTFLATANPFSAFSIWAATNYLFGSNKRDNEDSQTYGDREPTTLVDQDKPVPIVYGRCKVGGSLVRLNAVSETQAKWIVAYCEGAVYSATQLYINDIAFGDLFQMLKVTYLYSRSFITKSY